MEYEDLLEHFLDCVPISFRPTDLKISGDNIVAVFNLVIQAAMAPVEADPDVDIWFIKVVNDELVNRDVIAPLECARSLPLTWQRLFPSMQSQSAAEYAIATLSQWYQVNEPSRDDLLDLLAGLLPVLLSLDSCMFDALATVADAVADDRGAWHKTNLHRKVIEAQIDNLSAEPEGRSDYLSIREFSEISFGNACLASDPRFAKLVWSDFEHVHGRGTAISGALQPGVMAWSKLPGTNKWWRRTSDECVAQVHLGYWACFGNAKSIDEDEQRRHVDRVQSRAERKEKMSSDTTFEEDLDFIDRRSVQEQFRDALPFQLLELSWILRYWPNLNFAFADFRYLLQSHSVALDDSKYADYVDEHFTLGVELSHPDVGVIALLGPMHMCAQLQAENRFVDGPTFWLEGSPQIIAGHTFANLMTDDLWDNFQNQIFRDRRDAGTYLQKEISLEYGSAKGFETAFHLMRIMRFADGLSADEFRLDLVPGSSHILQLHPHSAFQQHLGTADVHFTIGRNLVELSPTDDPNQVSMAGRLLHEFLRQLTIGP